MALSGDIVVTLVLGGLFVQTVYYTVLVFALAARISARLAVMEFKVNQLWAETEEAKEGF